MAVVLRAVRGATFTEPLAITNRDGTPTDLTGATITWLAKEHVDDPDADAVLSASLADTKLVLVGAPTLGTVRFAIPAADTAPLDPQHVYAWTLAVTVGTTVVRYPDAFQGAPGKLIIAPSAIA